MPAHEKSLREKREKEKEKNKRLLAHGLCAITLSEHLVSQHAKGNRYVERGHLA